MENKVLTVGELQGLAEEAENDEETGMSSISFVGVEIIDKNTKELKEYHIATGAWLNVEKDHLTITVEVDNADDITVASDEEVLDASKRLIAQNKEAYEVLAK